VLFDEDINMHHELSKYMLYYLVYYTLRYFTLCIILQHASTLSVIACTYLSSDHITLRKALLHALQAVENSLQD
jgi:hypothetical protein